MNNVKILQKMGYEIHYATDLNNVVYGKDNSRLDNTGIITHQIDFVRSPFSKNVIKAYIQLKKLMLAGEFDLIHCHMPMSGVIARLAAQKTRKSSGRKVPVLYTAHGFHFCTGVPLINHEDFKRAQKFKVRGKAEYVPGVGVDISTDNIKYGKKPEYIQKITGRKISPETKVLVSIGELSKRKNHQLLIDMMADLKDMDIICIIGGTGEEEISLYNKIKEMHLEEKVLLWKQCQQVFQ